MHWAWMLSWVTNVIGKAEGSVHETLAAAAMVLFSSTTIALAANFTTIPKNKIVQSQSCLDRCQTSFDVCARLRGGSTTVGRNCEAEQRFCVLSCQTNPRGG